MSTVYKLPYTGNEIKGKIGQVDKNTTAIGQLSHQNDNIVCALNLTQSNLFNDFESGTFYNIEVGNEFLKFDNETYNKTRKRTSNVNKTLFDFKLSVEEGYKLLVLVIKNNVIQESSGYVSDFYGNAGKEYAVIVKASDDSDISTLNVSDVLTFKEYNVLKEKIEAMETELYGSDITSDVLWENGKAVYGTKYDNYLYVGFIEYKETDTINYFRLSDYIEVNGHEILKLMMIHSPSTKPISLGMCFYDKNKNVLFNYGCASPYGRKDGEPRAKMVKIYIPKKARYFRTTYWQEHYVQSNCPDLPFTYSFEKYSDCDKPFTHEIPINEEMANTIKRARQLTDIKWQPLVDVPRYCLIDGDYSGQSDTHFLDWCKSGNEYVGIPYSGSGEPDINTAQINSNTLCGKWGYYKFHMGIDVDFETFVTACRYPNSIFGERKNLAQYSFDSSPYGTYCSALVGYALGLKQPLWLVENFCKYNKEMRDTGQEYFACVGESIPNIEQSRIRLCDVIWNTWHVAIITDIIRDTNGNITHIEVSEATTVGNANNSIKFGKLGGLSRRKMWSIEEFYSWFRDYGLYRFKSFYGIEYHKSDYVNVGHEQNSMPVIDMPCIPYLGNKARYKKGYIVNTKILIGATGFTHVVIEKDGVEFKRIAISNEDYVNGDFSEIGNYSAYLTNGTTRTKSCNWVVE